MPRAPRPCATPGCPRLVPPGTRHCADHARQADRARGSRQARGYDRHHDRQRAQWAPLVATGTIPCARCGRPIPPGQPWDLGHSDDRTTWTGPEHATCNRAAGGRAAH